ncbi:uncharacterized protein [Ptychodera flava]|uniref:uncharacterized protein n=1 Tax=Ptychodera flava TaxID=63121 RepID=UPI00396A15E3
MALETCKSFLFGCSFKYKKSTDIQVAGSMLCYIMSRGHHPFESTYPYYVDLNGLRKNVIEGRYNIDCISSFPNLKILIEKMLGTDPGGRPDSRECLEIFLKILPGLESFPESPMDSDDIVTSAVCLDMAVNVTEKYLTDPDRCPVFIPTHQTVHCNQMK